MDKISLVKVQALVRMKEHRDGQRDGPRDGKRYGKREGQRDSVVVLPLAELICSSQKNIHVSPA